MPLHKGTGREMTDFTRAEALKDFPLVPRWSRDEYPFASTLEGGEGADVKLVPIQEQRIQGGVINGFYSKNNMNPGDCFYVKVVP